jgi:hypothetical protein
MANWNWDPAIARYRDDTGKFVSHATTVAWRDQAVDAAKAKATAAASNLARGAITPEEFRTEMKAVIKTSYGAQYVFGRGGMKAMTAKDWGKLGAEVKRQLGFLDGFINAINDKAVSGTTFSEDYLRNRAGMYLDGSVVAHGRGLASAWNCVPPGVPGDGGTQCGGRCRCTIQFDVEGHETIMTWTTVADDHVCPGCVSRGQNWNPYRFGNTTIPAS